MTFSGNGAAYLYDSTADTYVASRQIIPTTPAIQGFYGPLGGSPAGAYYLANGLIVNPALVAIGGSTSPGAVGTTPGPLPGLPGQSTVINTGQRNIAAVAGLNDTTFLRLTTSVRQNITTVTRDDPRTTLDMINLITGENSLIGVVPENPITSVFGTTRANVMPRQLVVDSTGTTAYAITLSGLSVIPLARASSETRPVVTSGARSIINSSDGTGTIRPGSFITITGANLASDGVAETAPPPTVLGGSCVTFGDVSAPLLLTAPNRIEAQVPDTLRPGTHVVEVRSLSTAQQSDPIPVTVRAN